MASKKRRSLVAVPTSKKNVTEDDSSLIAWLDQGADINAKNSDGYTLLHLAVVEGRTSEVSLLLGRGANTNVKDSDGTTPLHWAAHRGLVAIAGMLLDMRADINSKDIGGNTPLHLASSRGQLAMASFLLDRGADANLQENLDGGNTPLHCAAMDGHIELVKLLLRRGARAETQDFNGLTPLDHALDAGHNSLELLLRITMEKKKPILLSSPSRTVKKKTIVKASLKSRPASVSFNKNHVAEVAKIARPTRVAAKKRQ